MDASNSCPKHQLGTVNEGRSPADTGKMMKTGGRRVRHAWRDRTLRTKGLLVVALPLGALLFIAPLLFLSQREDLRTSDLVTRTLQVRSQIEKVVTLHLEASSWLRGFLLTSSSLFLEPYQAAVDELPDAIDRLAELISDNPEQVARVADLRPLTQEFMSTQDRVLSAYDPGRPPTATEQEDILHGTAVLDEIKALLGKMRAEENRLLSIRQAAANSANTRTEAFVWIGVPLGLFLGVIMTLLFSRGVARRIAGLEENSRRLAEGEGLLSMPEAGDEIGRLGRTLEEASALLQAREAAVRESEERARSIIEAANDAFIEMDTDGSITGWNRAAEMTFGWSRDEAVGQLVSETIIPPRYRDAHGRGLADFLSTGEGPVLGKRIELSALHRDGHEFPVELTVSVLRLGTAVSFTAFIHDISERKRAEEEVRQAKDEAERANLAKSEFLSRMSHELRTPLNAILGFGQLLEMDRLPPEHQESVSQILKAGRHLLDLINEVLDISRIEAGGLTLSPEPVRIADALSDALELIRPLAAARGIGISIDNRVDGHHVRADRQRLKQVLLNLLSNAVKYNAEGGHVTLSCTEDDGLMRIGVTDTGSGIAPEEMGRVFSPFDRLGRQEGDVEGTGLGLALSKGLMEAMGGRLDVESAPGEGSTFTVELPLAESPLALLDAHPAESVETQAPLAGQQTILYIEDNLSNLKLIERLFERRPQVRLLPTMQATQGIELARQHLPALILLDLHLPDMGGEEALRRLRADPLTRQIPVIVVSADATSGNTRRLLEAGASDYLTKPLDMTRFLDVIDATLRRTVDTAEDRA
jgi:PAS domain S-box-containing protein